MDDKADVFVGALTMTLTFELFEDGGVVATSRPLFEDRRGMTTRGEPSGSLLEPLEAAGWSGARVSEAIDSLRALVQS